MATVPENIPTTKNHYSLWSKVLYTAISLILAAALFVVAGGGEDHPDASFFGAGIVIILGVAAWCFAVSTTKYNYLPNSPLKYLLWKGGVTISLGVIIFIYLRFFEII